MNMNIISKYLQFLRKSNNYTQDDLAKELGISRQAVSKWETGTTIPDLEILLKNILNFLVNRLQIYHSNYLVLHILNSFYPNSAYIFSCHFKIYIGKQSFTKTICFGRCPH